MIRKYKNKNKIEKKNTRYLKESMQAVFYSYILKKKKTTHKLQLRLKQGITRKICFEETKGKFFIF